MGVTTITSTAQWEAILADASAKGIPVVVDFNATWCGPCRMISPYFHELSAKFDGKAVFVEVDVDVNQDLSTTYNISAMPTFKLFKEGKPVEDLVGASKDKLLKLVESHVTAAVPA